MRITRHLAKVALAAIATTSVTGFVGQPRTSDAAPSAEPALLWLESELTDNGGAFDFPPFPPFPPSVDWGLTIDVIIALSAGGRGGAPAATTATAGLAEHINDYVTGDATGDPGSHYAGPIGKSMLAASLQGADVHSFGGVDLEALSRASIQKSGTYVGRFTDVSTFGDFSNGFGQALNILALSRTSAGVPSIAADFLLDQQCPSGGFRLFYDAVDPANSTRGCESGDEADTDATAFSLQAVLALDPGPTTSAAIANAATFLIGQQDPATGGFRGTGPTAPANSNTTGIAAQALEAAGFAEAAALARAYIESLQLDAAQTTSTPAAGEDGAIALNPGAFDDALASGIAAPQRDQWRRATAQAVLGLDLPELAIPRADPVPLRSARLLDTRAGESTIDGMQRGAGLIPAGSTVVLPVAGRGGVPDDASAVVLNVTAVDGLGVGFVTVFPCSTDRWLPASTSAPVPRSRTR